MTAWRVQVVLQVPGLCQVLVVLSSVVLSLSGTVRGLVYLGDGIDHLFLTLRSLQVIFSSC